MENVTLSAPSSWPGIVPEKEKVRFDKGCDEVASVTPGPATSCAYDTCVKARITARNRGKCGSALRFINGSPAGKEFPGACLSGEIALFRRLASQRISHMN